MAGADGDDVQRMLAELRSQTAAMKEMADTFRRARVEIEETLPAEREALLGTESEQRERAEEYAEEARTGAHGRARAELQARMDRGVTSWPDVMSGVDQHWSAEEVRDEVVGGVREAISDLEQEDPEFSAEFRQIATLLAPGAAPGDWSDVDDPAPEGGQDDRPDHGQRPATPRQDRDQTPGGGTW